VHCVCNKLAYMHLLVLLTHTVYVCVVSYCVHWLVDMLLSDCAQQLLCALVGGYAACQAAHSSCCVHCLVDMLLVRLRTAVIVCTGWWTCCLSDCAQQLLCALVGGYAACQTAHSSCCVHWLVDMLHVRLRTAVIVCTGWWICCMSDCAQQLLCALVGGYAACQTAHSSYCGHWLVDMLHVRLRTAVIVGTGWWICCLSDCAQQLLCALVGGYAAVRLRTAVIVCNGWWICCMSDCAQQESYKIYETQ